MYQFIVLCLQLYLVALPPHWPTLRDRQLPQDSPTLMPQRTCYCSVPAAVSCGTPPTLTNTAQTAATGQSYTDATTYLLLFCVCSCILWHSPHTDQHCADSCHRTVLHWCYNVLVIVLCLQLYLVALPPHWPTLRGRQLPQDSPVLMPQRTCYCSVSAAVSCGTPPTLTNTAQTAATGQSYTDATRYLLLFCVCSCILRHSPHTNQHCADSCHRTVLHWCHNILVIVLCLQLYLVALPPHWPTLLRQTAATGQSYTDATTYLLLFCVCSCILWHSPHTDQHCADSCHRTVLHWCHNVLVIVLCLQLFLVALPPTLTNTARQTAATGQSYTDATTYLLLFCVCSCILWHSPHTDQHCADSCHRTVLHWCHNVLVIVLCLQLYLGALPPHWPTLRRQLPQDSPTLMPQRTCYCSVSAAVSCGTPPTLTNTAQTAATGQSYTDATTYLLLFCVCSCILWHSPHTDQHCADSCHRTVLHWCHNVLVIVLCLQLYLVALPPHWPTLRRQLPQDSPPLMPQRTCYCSVSAAVSWGTPPRLTNTAQTAATGQSYTDATTYLLLFCVCSCILWHSPHTDQHCADSCHRTVLHWCHNVLVIVLCLQLYLVALPPHWPTLRRQLPLDSPTLMPQRTCYCFVSAAVSCGTPPTLTNTAQTAATGQSYTDTTTYSCAVGYAFDNNYPAGQIFTLTCGATGDWSAPTQTCTGKIGIRPCYRAC